MSSDAERLTSPSPALPQGVHSQEAGNNLQVLHPCNELLRSPKSLTNLPWCLSQNDHQVALVKVWCITSLGKWKMTNALVRKTMVTLTGKTKPSSSYFPTPISGSSSTGWSGLLGWGEWVGLLPLRQRDWWCLPGLLSALIPCVMIQVPWHCAERAVSRYWVHWTTLRFWVKFFCIYSNRLATESSPFTSLRLPRLIIIFWFFPLLKCKILQHFKKLP